MNILSTSKNFLRQEAGVSLTEFAFVFPIMLFFFVCTLEVSNLIRLDRKVTYAAQTTVNLISLNRSIDDTALVNIFRASELSVFPFDGDNLSVGIISVEFDPDDGSPSVGWAENLRTGENLRKGIVNNAIAKADSFEKAGHSVMIARAIYSYKPTFIGSIFGRFDIKKMAYARPRNSLIITRE